MNLKAKAIVLGLLAALAVSAVAAVNVSATAGGHLTSDKDNTTLEIFEQGVHQLKFVPAGGTGVICEETTYHSKLTAKTVTAVPVTPTYNKCKTTGAGSHNVTVALNGCSYEFTIRSDPENKHSTVHIKCPTGKIVIQDTATNCKIEIGQQTVEGVTYTKEQWEGTKALTVDFTIKNIQYTQHQGVCVFAGTNQAAGELKGAIIVKAWEEGKVKMEGGGANITVT